MNINSFFLSLYNSISFFFYSYCPQGYTSFLYADTVRCYQYFDTAEDWNTASTICNNNNNGWLVTIHNLEENNYLYDNSIQSSSYWIGYNDVAVWDYVYYKALDEGTSGFTGTIYGSATKLSGYVSLTSNVYSQSGQIEYNLYPGNRMYAAFDTWSGGGNGADAIYFYWGATSRPTHEEASSVAYIFAIDEFNNNELQLVWNGTRLYTKSIGNIDDSTWHSWAVEWINNTITVWRDGVFQFTKIDSARTLSTNSKIGWGGRTGGQNNHHRVRNMKIYTGDNYYGSNEDCTYIKNGFLWNDFLCSQIQPFICETSTTICPSGTYSMAGSSSWYYIYILILYKKF